MRRHKVGFFIVPNTIKTELQGFDREEIVRPEVALKDDCTKIRYLGSRGGDVSIDVRNLGNFADLGVFLPGMFDWDIIEDNQGVLVLVATEKKQGG